MTARRKNPTGKFRIYSPENKKYMTGVFRTETIAIGVAQNINKLTGMPMEVRLNGDVVAKVGKISPRLKNPVKKHGTEKQARVVKAMQLFQRFRLEEPKFVDEIKMDFHDVLMKIGTVNAIEYDTRRNGKTEFYRHEFTGKSRPDLASSWDGKQIYVLGGHYNFTDEGIVDYDPKTGKSKY